MKSAIGTLGILAAMVMAFQNCSSPGFDGATSKGGSSQDSILPPNDLGTLVIDSSGDTGSGSSSETGPGSSGDAGSGSAPVNLKPRFVNGHSSTYYLRDSRVLAYTGATVSDSVAYCIQNRADGRYPCINGDVSNAFGNVPRPASPLSPNQELIWSSEDFFAIAGFDFGDYEVVFRRRNSDGSLGDGLGSLVVQVRLTPDEPGIYYGYFDSRGSFVPSVFSSTSGPNVFSVLCRIPRTLAADVAIPAGYRAYPYFNDKDCYYKIN